MTTLHFHPSPNPFKVLLLLEELGEPYDLRPVDTFRGEQHAPDFLALNPNAKVPVLVEDDGTAVFDSNAILLHLALTRGRFLADGDAGRAEALSWLMLVATGLSPFSGQAVHFLKMAPEEIPYARNRYLKEVERHYHVLDARLVDREYLAGDYGVVDMAAWGWMRFAGYVFDDALDGFPNAKRLFETISARSAAERAATAAERHAFKTDFDEETARALFPQNSR